MIRSKTWIRLMIGDAVAYALATALGFLRHGSLGQVSFARILATYVPFLIAWIALAPWLGVYRPLIAKDWRLLWRPLLAALYAAPLGALLRAVLLQSVITPIFVIVMGLVTAGLISVWRGIYCLVAPD